MPFTMLQKSQNRRKYPCDSFREEGSWAYNNFLQHEEYTPTEISDKDRFDTSMGETAQKLND